MTTPKKDPNFPNRPGHPDFWELADAVQHVDALADSGLTVGDIVTQARIDLNSLVYMAKQRVLRLFANNPVPTDSADLEALVAANWIDGFMAGRRHTQERTVAPADGNRRKVWE